MKAPVITTHHLRGACREQRAIFRKTWPDGAALTIRNANRALSLGLDIEWLAARLLTDQALAEYKRVTALALAELERVRDQAWAELEFPAWAPAWAEYKRVRDQALAEYERVTTHAFVRLYRKQLVEKRS